ncbi:MAG: aminomethyl transferase family protein [Acidobacteria bacterium]|nr:aminomethyl transferase family protein [Acidobacteriota bacterium]
MTLRFNLRDTALKSGARLETRLGSEVVAHFGNPLHEYHAVRDRAGFIDVSYSGRLRVGGKDRVRYMHNMVSNDVRSLAPGKGCYAALLTRQGRMESDLYVYALADELRLECPGVSRTRVFGTLNHFIVGDVVAIEDVSDGTGLFSVQGPQALQVMERTTGAGLRGLEELDHLIVRQGTAAWMVVRRDRTGCGGYDLWMPAADLLRVWLLWRDEFGIQPVGHAALDWLRTEAGIPCYGVDMDERSLPMEMGLDSAVSMTKGCYRGQEIVARVIHRGRLDRILAGLAVHHSEPPLPGAEVQIAGAGIGRVTSAVRSPRLGLPLALAVIRTAHLAPGTRVEVVCGTTLCAAEVVPLPLRPAAAHSDGSGSGATAL